MKTRTGKILVLISGVTVVLFLSLLYLLFLDPLVNKPDSNIEVTRNVKPLVVPTEIKAGKVFRYHSEGEKMVSNSATVRRQLVCENDGAQSIIMIDEIESNLPIGKYSLDREMVIPVSQRLKSSDKCHLEFTSTYTFYQTNRWREESSFQIKKTNKSNEFKLITNDSSAYEDELNNIVALAPITEPDGIKVDKIRELTPVAVTPIKNDTAPLAYAAPKQSEAQAQPEPQKDTSKPKLVPWLYKVVSSSGTQLGVYNLPVNAVIKYHYVNGNAKIYTKEGVDVTSQLLAGK